MRICHLTMTGFGPFRDTEEVDFEAFDEDGIFLITGRTGAGKTSILDAVSFALFGSVPRYAGGADDAVRSRFLAPGVACQVVLEFAVGESRYRVSRSTAFTRARSRGEGTTTVDSTAVLEQLSESQWRVLETRKSETARRIAEIVRLNAAQFRQVVLLAQGQFQEFLVAESNDRAALLRRLFGTERFVAYKEILDRRAKELAERYRVHRDDAGLRAGQLARLAESEPGEADGPEALLGWAQAILHAQRSVVQLAASRVEELTSNRELARRRHEAARATADLQQRRARARARLTDLEADQGRIETESRRLEAAMKAATVRPQLIAWQQGADRLAALGLDLDRARIAHRQGWRAGPEELLELAAAVEELAGEVGGLGEPLRLENELTALVNQAAGRRAELEVHDAAAAASGEERDRLRELASGLDRRARSLAEQVGGLQAAEQAWQKSGEVLTAAEQAERLQQDLSRAQAAALEAGERLTAASHRRDQLRRRQLDGYAAVLAGQLVAGQRCAVCGATEHPLPARPGADQVGEVDLGEAEEAMARAIEASQRTSAEVSGLSERLGIEKERCEGKPVAEAMASRRAAQQHLDGLQTVASDLEAARAELAGTSAAVERLGATLENGLALRGTLLAALTAAEDRVGDVTQTVATARAGYASVAERLDDTRERRRLGQSFLDAAAEVSRAERLQDELLQSRNAALAEAGFDDAEAATRAFLAPDKLTDLDRLVSEHAAAVALQRLALGEAELQDLPEEEVDVEEPARQRLAVEAETEVAEQELGRARPILEMMTATANDLTTSVRLATEVRAEHDVTARLAASLRGAPPNTMRMELESFVLAAELEDIVAAANLRLKAMTAGRYELHHRDDKADHGRRSGLSLVVLDAYNGEERAPTSLSGGEKFQASLALALGLAEVVTSRAGGIRLDTLFIDEGFGSLDSDTLEATMATLDGLREGGRTLGLISHVDSLREAIPAQLRVAVTSGGWSTIEPEPDTAEVGSGRLS